MTTRSLTIELPAKAHLPQKILGDQELLRYAVAGALCTGGLLSLE